ncbi:MAG: peptidoglycan DD-metalloendopeptidase family protein [Chitinophagaceae bacterium]|nr:peptidoglycan DD-metalloendopeptidase family protein [Chitinophagaceae bacterium]
MLKKHLLITLIFTSVATALLAQPQDKAQLERERQEIQNELKQIQGMYDKIKGQKKQSLGQLNMLKKKINLQERYISSINRELKMIDDDIYLSNLEIYRLQKQLDTLKSQYARSVVYAYKNRSNYDYVNFIFSSISFNDAIRRISYLKSYRTYREKQVNTILETQQLIGKRQQQQLGRKQQKNMALQSQVKERTVLDVQRKEKDAVVSDLKSQEKDLQKQLAVKKKRDRDLKNAIDAIVKREIAKAAEEAKRKAEAEKKNTVLSPVVTNPASGTTKTAEKVEVKKTGSYLDLNASDVKLNGEFQANRGKLPWPVDNGFVSVHFGPYTIEGTDLRDNNPGVTIATPSAGGAVKAVFDGEVVAIHNYGDGVAVIIRHGKYFTSYSNLSGVSVGKGAQVRTGQAIGRVGEAQDGSGGQVDFMLMIEKNNVNPETWLRR